MSGVTEEWDMIQVVYDLARKAAVSFSLVYEEAGDTWYGVVSSAAPSEEIVTKSGSLSLTIYRLRDHLQSLINREI